MNDVGIAALILDAPPDVSYYYYVLVCCKSNVERRKICVVKGVEKMTDERNHGANSSEEKPRKREMSRRQFLTYTLGGTGAFMVGMPLASMLRFSVDPILQPKTKGDWVKVVEVDKVTEEPTSFSFQKHQVDGWVESDPEFSAWISKGKDGKIFALSPICKHLGCTINWNTDPANFPNEYICPCHDAHYTPDGKNLTVAPTPLDEYSVKIENGFVYLGPVKPNTRV